ncbi:lipase [Novymonas esmeraldas]|uniref:Lipase n=1 Tax=Novymonas esmeraldas TaxID=1808958 RepID=A0AAW0EVW5_9TRYP
MRRALLAVAVAAAMLLSTVVLADTQLVPYRFVEADRSHNFARASYCLTPSVMSWNCGRICRRVPGFYAFTIFQHEVFDTFGYAGVDTVNQQIVLAFRGSVTLMNWLQDLSFVPIPYNTAPSCGRACRVHMGFQNSYLSVRPQVNMAVMRLLGEFPGYQVLVTGHSLGGAMAVLAAVDVQEQFNKMPQSTKPVALYTFGAPRVGNPAFAQWTAAILANGPHYRITHGLDPVPQLPPRSFGFRHAPTEVFYRTMANSSGVVCNDSPTAESRKCSNKYLAVMLTDHLFYMGEPMGCLPFTAKTLTLPVSLYTRLVWEFTKNSFGV